MKEAFGIFERLFFKMGGGGGGTGGGIWKKAPLIFPNFFGITKKKKILPGATGTVGVGFSALLFFSLREYVLFYKG